MARNLTPKVDEVEDFQCLGHSNWTICLSFSPFCSGNVPIFHFYPGRSILITPSANNGKRYFFEPHKWMRQRTFGAWDIQTGPFAFLLAPVVVEIFDLFHFHTGRPILIAL